MTVIPSREDSYERLLDMAVQFAEKMPSTEEQVLQRMEAEQLHKALSLLTDDVLSSRFILKSAQSGGWQRN